MTPDDRHVYRSGLPRRSVALAAMAASGLMFAVMGVMTKMCHTPEIVGRAMPASQVVMARFAIGLLAMLPLQGRRGIDLLGHDRRRLLMRGLWGAFAVYFYFLSIQLTTLAHAQILNYTSILFAPLFAWVLLRERLTRRTGGAIILAIGGIAMITLQHGLGGALRIGDLYALISGLLAGAAITEIRRLRRSETAWSVFFYLCLVGIPIGAVACMVQPPVMPTSAGWAALAAMGAASIAAQMLMTFGFKYVMAAEGSILMMTQLLYNSAAGLFLFSEALTLWTLSGAALIVAAALVLTVFTTSHGE